MTPIAHALKLHARIVDLEDQPEVADGRYVHLDDVMATFTHMVATSSAPLRDFGAYLLKVQIAPQQG